MDFGQLQNMVMNAAQRYADRDVAKQHIQETYQDLAISTRCLKTSISLDLPADNTTGDYDLVTDFGVDDCAAIRFLVWSGPDNAAWPLTPTTTDNILNLRVAQPASSWVRTYAFDPPSTLRLYPVGSGVATLYYVQAPAPMDLDSDTPDAIPARFHRGIAYGAIAEAALAVPATADRYAARYEQIRRQLRGYLNTSDSALPEQMTSMAAAIRPHDPSTDLGG